MALTATDPIKMICNYSGGCGWGIANQLIFLA